MDQRGHASAKVGCTPATPTAETVPDLRIEFNEEGIPGATPEGLEQALRLLARLLVRAATAPTPDTSTEPEKPLDVAAVPKVVSKTT